MSRKSNTPRKAAEEAKKISTGILRREEALIKLRVLFPAEGAS